METSPELVCNLWWTRGENSQIRQNKRQLRETEVGHSTTSHSKVFATP